MARIMVVGSCAVVELTVDMLDGGVIAMCAGAHSPFGPPAIPTPGNCSWTAHYDDWNDATEYAQDHADEGTI